MKPLRCECGRPARVFRRGKRTKPKQSHTSHRGLALPGHDLCERCFKRMKEATRDGAIGR